MSVVLHYNVSCVFLYVNIVGRQDIFFSHKSANIAFVGDIFVYIFWRYEAFVGYKLTIASTQKVYVKRNYGKLNQSKHHREIVADLKGSDSTSMNCCALWIMSCRQY